MESARTVPRFDACSLALSLILVVAQVNHGWAPAAQLLLCRLEMTGDSPRHRDRVQPNAEYPSEEPTNKAEKSPDDRSCVQVDILEGCNMRNRTKMCSSRLHAEKFGETVAAHHKHAFLSSLKPVDMLAWMGICVHIELRNSTQSPQLLSRSCSGWPIYVGSTGRSYQYIRRWRDCQGATSLVALDCLSYEDESSWLRP